MLQVAWSTQDELLAMRVFSYSVIYLIALFAFLLIDHYLPIPHPLYTSGGAAWIKVG